MMAARRASGRGWPNCSLRIRRRCSARARSMALAELGEAGVGEGVAELLVAHPKALLGARAQHGLGRARRGGRRGGGGRTARCASEGAARRARAAWPWPSSARRASGRGWPNCSLRIRRRCSARARSMALAELGEAGVGEGVAELLVAHPKALLGARAQHGLG